jgi:hypothetical protein
MDFGKLHFGSIAINGVTYEHECGHRPRQDPQAQEEAFKKFREQFGHTPVSAEEKAPWRCRCLVIGTGNYGSLPVMDEVKREAQVGEREGLAHDNARSPVEMSLKARLRELLRK